MTASALYRQTGIGLSLVAIGGYCAVKLRELVAYAHHIGKNVIGVYSESHAARQQNQEALTYLRRPEGWCRSIDPLYDEFDAGDTDSDISVSLAELNEALEALQRAVSVNDCCEQENLRLGNLGDPSDE